MTLQLWTKKKNIYIHHFERCRAMQSEINWATHRAKTTQARSRSHNIRIFNFPWKIVRTQPKKNERMDRTQMLYIDMRLDGRWVGARDHNIIYVYFHHLLKHEMHDGHRRAMWWCENVYSSSPVWSTPNLISHANRRGHFIRVCVCVCGVWSVDPEKFKA